MEYLRPHNLHKILVDSIFFFLRKDDEKKHIVQLLVNNNNSGRRRKIILKTGEAVYPDIINFDRKLVYEIHVKGERRGNYFDKLPDDWRGINVFYDEEDNPETLVVKFITSDAQIIKWQGTEKYTKYMTTIKPHVQFLKEQIKNKGKEIIIPVVDLLKLFEMTGKISIHNMRYALFFEGITSNFVRRHIQGTCHDENCFVIRERVEGDMLPVSLISEDNTKKEELMKSFSDWLDKHNLDYIGVKAFDVEFHVFQTIEKQ